jgi:hypothetical protein
MGDNKIRLNNIGSIAYHKLSHPQKNLCKAIFGFSDNKV